ncbi:hypothetical protein [Anaerobium acetethylicum]|uniref:Phage protein n=1 Tax=Anaerobium acetethylicum TaxID=1619234 RepID=A0A1D3TU17_9FIRM|nr:hypothetical protein [Anaerobium acetethylicum]SCP97523.1 hypothetical protein SAMN05421730_101153 [Anaerobium acetethylicum]
MGVKFSELINLVHEYREGKTQFSIDEIEDKAYEYYKCRLISMSQYDNILCNTYVLQ